MAALRVTCVTPDSLDADRRIEAIGGDGFNHSIDEAIRNRVNNVHIYYTLVKGKVAFLVVERHYRSGRLFLQMLGDIWPHNSLLSLQTCGRR